MAAKNISILLSAWLYVVAALRILSVVVGITNAAIFRDRLFSKAQGQVSPLYGRTFSTWTFTTCVLCVLTARNPDPHAPIFTATLFSFVSALAHFSTELLWFETMTLGNALSPLVVASISIVWMSTILAITPVGEAMEKGE
mmetsp:Transcript_23444/g.73021  ORF Transcript_23444/g.73021 Transcript_23444/m.73021 type:complete len:141 (+) Transcript_23444:107-529(+)